MLGNHISEDAGWNLHGRLQQIRSIKLLESQDKEEKDDYISTNTIDAFLLGGKERCLKGLNMVENLESLLQPPPLTISL
ncbi:hypothetical protein QUC31_003455 [Theobroma cacao]